MPINPNQMVRARECRVTGAGAAMRQGPSGVSTHEVYWWFGDRHGATPWLFGAIEPFHVCATGVRLHCSRAGAVW